MMRSLQSVLAILLLALLGCASLGSGKVVVELNVTNFESELYAGLGENPIEWIIEFYTPWCSVCRQFNPVFSVVAKQYQTSGSHIRFGKVNADEELALSARFMISSIPTVYYVKISPGEDEKLYQVKTAMNEQDWAKTIASQHWIQEQPWDSVFSPFSISGKLLYVIAKWVAIAWNQTLQLEKDHGIPPWAVLLGVFTLSLAVPFLLAYFLGDHQQQPQPNNPTPASKKDQAATSSSSSTTKAASESSEVPSSPSKKKAKDTKKTK